MYYMRQIKPQAMIKQKYFAKNLHTDKGLRYERYRDGNTNICYCYKNIRFVFVFLYTKIQSAKQAKNAATEKLIQQTFKGELTMCVQMLNAVNKKQLHVSIPSFVLPLFIIVIALYFCTYSIIVYMCTIYN